MSFQQFSKRIRVPMGFAVAAVYLWWAKPHGLSCLLSLCLVVPGLLLRAYAAGYVKKNAELTRTGPYAYTRNPLYLGSLLLVLGFGAAAGSWLLLLLVSAVFLAIYLPVIKGEEQYLRAHFAGFDEYAAEVPRLFPRFTPLRSGKAASFSAERYRRHREYNAAMGAAAIYLALALKIWIAWYRRVG